MERLPAPPRYDGLAFLPSSGAYILAANHYQRKGLWILHTAAVLTRAVATRQTPVLDPPVRWMVTANWPPWRLGPFTIPSPGDRLLPKVAGALHCYPVSFAGSNPAFTAQSVRRILRDVKQDPRPIGIFPEGVAGAAGVLTDPLPGVDRLLAHLGKAGLPLVPCGIHEEGRQLVARFGEPIPGARLAAVPDAARLAMEQVAALLG